MQQNERLIDMLNHLPAGTTLSTTPNFERVYKRTLHNASILQACSLVLDLALQEQEAELRDRDGLETISVYTAAKYFPSPAFTVERS